MITTGALLGIAAVALGLVLTPGPNMIYLVSRTLTQGRRAGLVSLTGVAAGFLVYLTAATAGLVAIFTVVPALYTAIKLAGAAYLLYLAWQAVKPGARSPLEPVALPPDSPARLYRMGVLTCLLNPKAAVLYLSILPQFVDPHRGSVFAQSVLLGCVQISISFSFNLMIALAAAGVSAWFTRRPKWLATQRWFMGSVLGGLALRMALEPRRLL